MLKNGIGKWKEKQTKKLFQEVYKFLVLPMCRNSVFSFYVRGHVMGMPHHIGWQINLTDGVASIQYQWNQMLAWMITFHFVVVKSLNVFGLLFTITHHCLSVCLSLPALWIWKEICVDDLCICADIDIMELKNGRACSDDFEPQGTWFKCVWTVFFRIRFRC